MRLADDLAECANLIKVKTARWLQGYDSNVICTVVLAMLAEKLESLLSEANTALDAWEYNLLPKGQDANVFLYLLWDCIGF
jgi:hypothetical protein